MPKARKLVRGLYKLARTSNDITTLFSGSPKRIIRRGANKWIGRKVGRRLFFRRDD